MENGKDQAWLFSVLILACLVEIDYNLGYRYRSLFVLKFQFLYEGATPKSCADIKRLYPLATDGEYDLYVRESHEPVSLYCYGLSTSAPKTFITLQAGRVQLISTTS